LSTRTRRGRARTRRRTREQSQRQICRGDGVRRLSPVALAASFARYDVSAAPPGPRPSIRATPNGD
jgi:hypothetical protein